MEPVVSNYAVSVVTPPALEPVDLQRAKIVCGVDLVETHWNDDLTRLIKAAREYVETRWNVSLVSQTLRLFVRRFPCGRDRQYLPRGPVQSLSAVEYVDAAGDDQTIADAVLHSAFSPAFIVPAGGEFWPTTESDNAAAVEIEYVAGYGDPSEVPEIAKRAILLLVSHWFVNREAVLVGTTSDAVELGLSALGEQLDSGDAFICYGR